MQNILSGRNETSQIHSEEQSEETIETRVGGMQQEADITGPAVHSPGGSRLRWSYPEEGASTVTHFPTLLGFPVDSAFIKSHHACQDSLTNLLCEDRAYCYKTQDTLSSSSQKGKGDAINIGPW